MPHVNTSGKIDHCLNWEPPRGSRVPGLVDSWFDGGGFLRQGEGFKLAGQREDVAGQGRRSDPCELRIHLDNRPFGHVVPGDRALVRGGRGVVSFGHFRAVALLEDELLLRQEIVREHPVELPDFAEFGQFGGRVVTTPRSSRTGGG